MISVTGIDFEKRETVQKVVERNGGVYEKNLHRKNHASHRGVHGGKKVQARGGLGSSRRLGDLDIGLCGERSVFEYTKI